MNKNHFLPFLWVHGESPEVYREMVNAIYNANLREFCVEARPHKEFCKDAWWHDLGVILEEAEKLGMRVWILDDEHFPTGYAAGAVLKAPTELRRQFLCHKRYAVKGGRTLRLALKDVIAPIKPKSIVEKGTLRTFGAYNPENVFDDDSLLSLVAVDGKGSILDLTDTFHDGKLTWKAPAGNWQVEAIILSRNSGYHRSYINMLDSASCRLQVEAVYEPHYAHFGDKFGTVIAGFFSDEPELGNGCYTDHEALLGKEQSLPYSRELGDLLQEALGADWKEQLYLLWSNDGSAQETARVRYHYMDCVTRLVSATFSRQLGEWCRAHGVEYIGHMVEDENQHGRTGCGLGHYFRGLKWQTMAGIDDIGGQVQFGGEDFRKRAIMGFTYDGEFYHYALGKLAFSLGAISPRMQGRAMCEIFGNYGWKSGVREQKYLLDHFLVNGINYYVPHAFDSAPYPDKDCPPHFYAHGNNPQYRHFGELMRYGERVCRLLDGGKPEVRVGVLYHAEAEWSGTCMLMQKPARVLTDNQINFCFLPGDVFADSAFYHTDLSDGLTVNNLHFELLIVPYAAYLPRAVLEGLAKAREGGCKVVFLDGLPTAASEGGEIPVSLKDCEVTGLSDLTAEADKYRDLTLMTVSSRIRTLHYYGEKELYLLVNEGASSYRGTVRFSKPVYAYDPWNDRYFLPERKGDGVNLSLEPRKSVIFFVGEAPAGVSAMPKRPRKAVELKDFAVSRCEAKEYPAFHDAERITLPNLYAKKHPGFAGFLRYTTEVELSSAKKISLDIADAYEGVEVFVNGRSVGMQVVPHFVFDITDACVSGKNEIAIEVATTLERHHKLIKRTAAPTGITGEVTLFIEE